ncbi:hypothetical protein [Campylobacter concisus]|uniref:hypothetical protein n=1 Tax=Campylobacter concisus TaxID=199 RepID=UPI001F2A1E64|nr:hypothetical protein [Campylobacter concisus]
MFLEPKSVKNLGEYAKIYAELKERKSSDYDFLCEPIHALFSKTEYYDSLLEKYLEDGDVEALNDLIF